MLYVALKESPTTCSILQAILPVAISFLKHLFEDNNVNLNSEFQSNGAKM